jgi:AcrR family transcriptional regulator
MDTSVTKRRPVELSREELYRRVWSEPITTVAAKLGLSGNALAKICNRLLVPYPSRGHWAKRNGNRARVRPPLPPAPEQPSASVTISSERAGSRRARTRLAPGARREQLIQVAEQIIGKRGLHAASMKQIAAVAGISETQAYNYFRSREHLLVELARREFATIRAARQEDIENTREHYELITRTTQTYLRKIGERGGLLLTLLSSPDVRASLRAERRQRQATQTRSHAKGLAELYGIPRDVAFGCTSVLTTMCLRAGKLIADKRISLPVAERLCLALVVQGSRDIVRAYQPGEHGVRRTQGS